MIAKSIRDNQEQDDHVTSRRKIVEATHRATHGAAIGATRTSWARGAAPVLNEIAAARGPLSFRAPATSSEAPQLGNDPRWASGRRRVTQRRQPKHTSHLVPRRTRARA